MSPCMKYLIHAAFILLIPFAAWSQKQANIWYFHGKCGLDFSSGTPVPITGGMTGVNGNGSVGGQSGTSCISDSSGKMLFYLGVGNLYNRNHKVMAKGDNIMVSYALSGTVIVPLPGSNRIFYFFTGDTGKPMGYRYSIIDMCLDSNRGAVVDGKKNIVLTGSGVARLAACYDGKSGYWIMGHRLNNTDFIAWHLTSSGITDSVISSIGAPHNYSNLGNFINDGQMKFSPDGKKLAVIINTAAEYHMVQLFDFNLQTGVLNSSCDIPINYPPLALSTLIGIEFSPDASKLYVSEVIRTIPSMKNLYQFDLSNSDCATIGASRQTIFSSSITANYQTWEIKGLQLAPNGKIYAVIGTLGNIACINFPNQSGPAVSFDSDAVKVNNVGSNAWAFPNFVAGLKLHNGAVSCTTTGPSAVEALRGTDVLFYPNPAGSTATLQIGSGTDIGEMALIMCDMPGRIVKTIPVTQHHLGINLADLPAGIYVYHLEQRGNRLKSGKIDVR